MNRLRKNSIATNARSNPIAIMVDANCAFPFDYVADVAVLAQPANYLKHDINDSRDQQALELFYVSSDSSYWHDAHLMDFDAQEFNQQINHQLLNKSALLLLVGDIKLLPTNNKATQLLSALITNQKIGSSQKASMASQVLQCHSVFAGQAALYHALMETLPSLLEGKIQQDHEHKALRKTLAVMQILKAQVNQLNKRLATWFICDEWGFDDDSSNAVISDEKQHRSIVDKWFGARPIFFYYQQKMHEECKKRSVRAAVEYVVVQLIMRASKSKRYPDVFFSYAGELKYIETKSWWQQVIKSLYDAGFMPHLTQAPLAQALTLGPRSLSIALIES